MECRRQRNWRFLKIKGEEKCRKWLESASTGKNMKEIFQEEIEDERPYVLMREGGGVSRWKD